MFWSVGVVIACLAAACSGDGGSGPATTGPRAGASGLPGWDAVDEVPELPPLDTGDPLWGSNQLEAVRAITSVAFQGNAVALEGVGADDRERLAVVDGPTGRLHWAVEAFGELPGGGGATWNPPGPRPDNILLPDTEAVAVAEDGDGWVVLVDYQLVPSVDATPEHGVAALSGQDGRVLWRSPSVSSRPGSAGTAAELLTSGPTLAHGDLVVTSAVPEQPTPGPPDPGYMDQVELVAVDVADGAPRWRQAGAWPLAVADGAVFALVADTAAPGAGDALPGATVALDPATGERLWDLSDRHPNARLVLAAGDAVVVEVVDESTGTGSETLILDVASGRELASFGTRVVVAEDCGTNGSLVACPVMTDPSDIDSSSLATFDLGHRDAGVAVRTIGEATGLERASVRGVGDGRVVVGDWDHASVALDRSGRRVDPVVPGVLVALSDRFLIVEEPRDELDEGAYTTYSLSADS